MNAIFKRSKVWGKVAGEKKWAENRRRNVQRALGSGSFLQPLIKRKTIKKMIMTWRNGMTRVE